MGYLIDSRTDTAELMSKIQLLKRSHAELVLTSVNLLDAILDNVMAIREVLHVRGQQVAIGGIGPGNTSMSDAVLKAVNAIDSSIATGLSKLDAAVTETASAYNDDVHLV